MADLPATQYLIMEVLAARARTGEQLWTFPSNLAVSLRALEDRGLLSVMHGVAPGSLRARLTELGRSETLKGDYVTPLAEKVLAAVEEGMKSAAELLTAAGRVHGTEHGLGVAYAIPKVKAHVRGALLGVMTTSPKETSVCGQRDVDPDAGPWTCRRPAGHDDECLPYSLSGDRLKPGGDS